jgi:hypothetical protein
MLRLPLAEPVWHIRRSAASTGFSQGEPTLAPDRRPPSTLAKLARRDFRLINIAKINDGDK